jgi:putative membrane protein
VRRTTFLAAGAATLALAWLGPLPALAVHRFSAHMTMHMAVVAVAAPLLALGVAGGPHDPVRLRPRWWNPIVLSMVELMVVWSWHTPALHRFARESTWGLLAEQGTFLASGLLLWIAAVGGDRTLGSNRTLGGERDRDENRAGAGVVALLLTSMHMTLLGALLALAPRSLYRHGETALSGAMPLWEQQLGGVVMLLVGGASYLVGGLGLSATLLRRPSAPRPELR